MPTSASVTVGATCSAPDVFGADEFGHCIVLEDEVDGALEAQARVGAENCPEQAITIERT